MIRHCVFIRFKPTISSAYKAELFNEIAALQNRLPGIAAVHIGANVSPEAGMDKGFGEGFIVDFTDSFARDAYLDDPAHRATGARLAAAAEGGLAGILVYDLEIDDRPA
ncbi:Dabb family protein [Shinella daejeonensis]|uniref:Dabb family protein n=1 Tax=Shinella daejeonensis TaxID=659017 RepID=UPI0020C80883|nr:Dabb family protein [Shinella daejeonensis]MCP8894383.1 Dabb family protein [Shinella daejeonensis]